MAGLMGLLMSELGAAAMTAAVIAEQWWCINSMP